MTSFPPKYIQNGLGRRVKEQPDKHYCLSQMIKVNVNRNKSSRESAPLIWSVVNYICPLWSSSSKTHNSRLIIRETSGKFYKIPESTVENFQAHHINSNQKCPNETPLLNLRKRHPKGARRRKRGKTKKIWKKKWTIPNNSASHWFINFNNKS